MTSTTRTTEDLERATATLAAIAERTAVGQRLERDDTDEAILRRVVRQSRDRLEAGRVEAPAAPIILVTTGHPTLHQHPGAAGENVHPRLGRLIQPRHTSSIELTAAAGIPWAADNDCFQGLDEVAFVRMLDRIAGLPGCLFATVPDVVGDSAATLAMFERWAPELERRGIPAGYVAQDGATVESTPWARVAAIFIGGSNDYKLGPDAAELAREAKRRGKWVHWGRVNTRRRFDLIVATGAADSFDGSKWARWRKTYLPTALEWLDEAAQARREALEAPAPAVRLRPRTVVVEGRELLAVAGGSPELDDADLVARAEELGVDVETLLLAGEACYCGEEDPRALEGGHRCGSCEARDEVRLARRMLRERTVCYPSAGVAIAALDELLAVEDDELDAAAIESAIGRARATAVGGHRMADRLARRIGSAEDALARAAEVELARRGLPRQAGGSPELDDPELRNAVAEYAVLEAFDVERDRRGHDYGGGQRRNELMRRRRALEALDRAGFRASRPLIVPTDVELAAAARRVLAPRLRRLEREDYRGHTPSSRRTREALEAVLAHFCPTHAERIEEGEPAVELSDEDRREATRIRRGLERAGIGQGGNLAGAKSSAEVARDVELELAAEVEAAGNPRRAELIRRAARGDGVARRAAKAYRTDAELEAAERLSAAQDYTDGGGPTGPDGRRLEDRNRDNFTTTVDGAAAYEQRHGWRH